MHPLLFLTFLLIAASTQASSLARITAALPEVDAPPHGDAQWIAQSMRLNGLPMTLKSFRSTLSTDALFSHYESWARTRRGSETRRSRNGDWQILGIKSQRYHITIQAQATIGGSEGTITVSPPLEGAAKIATSFPIPAPAAIVNLHEYEDSGIEAEHISLSSPRSVAMEAKAFTQALARDGWQIVRSQTMHEEPRGHSIEVQKGAQQALLTFLPDQARRSATAIIVVWRKS